MATTIKDLKRLLDEFTRFYPASLKRKFKSIVPDPEHEGQVIVEWEEKLSATINDK